MSASPTKLSLDSLLAQIGIFLKACPKVTLEWSLTVRAGTMSDCDRMTCWVEKSKEAGSQEPLGSFASVAQLLKAIAAPPSVQTIQATQSSISVRQGISVALLEHGIEWRLYLHTREPNATDRYQSWRWRSVASGSDPSSNPDQTGVQADHYGFYFLSATPTGETPIDLVHPLFVDAVQQLVQHERLRSMSGFWLRHRGDQVLQVDLIYPWYPRLAEFDSTLRSLVTTLGGSADWITTYADYPIRHIAFNGKDREPGFTLYFSAPMTIGWPSTLPTLKESVRVQSQKIQQHMEQTLFSRLPIRTTRSKQTTDTRPSVGDFYNTQRLDLWRQVLGNKMHYHFGIFEDCQQLPDKEDAIDAAFDRAISELYPFIPEGGRVYDIGCGWGGPLLQLQAELGCRVEGITISQTQAHYCEAKGLKVRHDTVEETLPPGYFDCMMMIESLCHIQDKLRLLKILRLFGKRLVIRAHCQDRHPASRNFGGTMLMNSSSQLRYLVEQAGWRIVHWQNRRLESMPSALVWQRRLQSIPLSNDQHLETLRDFCNRVVTHWDEWGESNPLIEIVAES
ncbi:MAG: methyltransferase domain-containing protein [Phormidesmis sp. RL_2_1]|nr:methyltransferase domain-containing protein [Phormidesmis sp. RL_2_1]